MLENVTLITIEKIKNILHNVCDTFNAIIIFLVSYDTSDL